jgi:hypothetical protein
MLVYGATLAATIAVEVVVVSVAAPTPLRRRAAVVCVAANLFTHPCATMLAWNLPSAFFVIELLVTAVEAGCYLRLVPLALRRALLLALCANLLTMGASLLWWAVAQA